jgi:AcrR family transcriptional regulator
MADSEARRVDGRTTRHLHRRPQLLDAVTNYVLDHGIAGFSLRPAAEALGVTHATLLRHFGTKEQLIVAVVEGICSDLVTQVTDRVGDLTAPTEHVLRTIWNHLCAPDERRQFLLLFEIVAMNAREPSRYGSLSTMLLDDLLAPLEENLTNNGHRPAAARELATGILAQTRGLQLDLAISNDRQRADRAMNRYIDMITAQHPPAPGSQD